MVLKAYIILREKKYLILIIGLLLYTSAFGYTINQYGPAEYKIKSPYSFSYGVEDNNRGTNFQRTEESDGDLVVGSYSVQLPDGRTQTVRYKADKENGFRADVSYSGEALYPHPSEYSSFNSNTPEQAPPFKIDFPFDYKNNPTALKHISQTDDKTETLIYPKQTENKIIRMNPIYHHTDEKNQEAPNSNVYDKIHVPVTSNSLNAKDILEDKSQDEDQLVLKAEPKLDKDFVQLLNTQENTNQQKMQVKNQNNLNNVLMFSLNENEKENVRYEDTPDKFGFHTNELEVKNSSILDYRNIKKLKPKILYWNNTSNSPGTETSRKLLEKDIHENLNYYFHQESKPYKINFTKEDNLKVPLRVDQSNENLYAVEKILQTLTADPKNENDIHKPQTFIYDSTNTQNLKSPSKKRDLNRHEKDAK